MSQEIELTTEPSASQNASVIFPLNKVGEKLLNKSINELVRGNFLEPGVNDLVKYYANHNVSQESSLPQLIDLCGYKIIAEINNVDLLYEVCRRYQAVEKMQLCLEGIWPEIEPQKLTASEQEYAQVNLQLFDYSREIEKRFSALSYIVCDVNKLKEKKGQFFNERLSEVKNIILTWVNVSITKYYDVNLYFDCESTRLLLKEIIKRSHDHLKIKFNGDDLSDIINNTYKELRKIMNSWIEQLRHLKEEQGSDTSLRFLFSKKYRQKFQSYQAIMEKEFYDLESKLDKLLLDLIMASIEKYSLAKV